MLNKIIEKVIKITEAVLRKSPYIVFSTAVVIFFCLEFYDSGNRGDSVICGSNHLRLCQFKNNNKKVDRR